MPRSSVEACVFALCRHGTTAANERRVGALAGQGCDTGVVRQKGRLQSLHGVAGEAALHVAKHVGAHGGRGQLESDVEAGLGIVRTVRVEFVIGGAAGQAKHGPAERGKDRRIVGEDDAVTAHGGQDLGRDRIAPTGQRNRSAVVEDVAGRRGRFGRRCLHDRPPGRFAQIFKLVGFAVRKDCLGRIGAHDPDDLVKVAFGPEVPVKDVLVEIGRKDIRRVRRRVTIRINVGLSQGLPLGKALASNDGRVDGGGNGVPHVTIDHVRIVVTAFIDKGVELGGKVRATCRFRSRLVLDDHGRRGVPRIALQRGTLLQQLVHLRPVDRGQSSEEAGENVKD
jgi:hypothetical protein